MDDSSPVQSKLHGISRDAPVAIIGAGPAGLTAGYELARQGLPVTVLERDGQLGGLARTVVYKGFRFDIGGHRFFTKVPAVQALWREMLGPELVGAASAAEHDQQPDDCGHLGANPKGPPAIFR